MPEVYRFDVDVLEWEEVHRLPGDWKADSLRSLLELADIDEASEIADGDLLDMALMALQDLDWREASALVLHCVFGERMSAGVRQNLADDLEDDRPWEQFADPVRQRGVFTAVVLLQQAFPTRFGKPDATRARLALRPADATARTAFTGEIDPALVVRILAAGMDERAVLRRLHGEGLQGRHFPEAASILWDVRLEPGDSAILEVHSSLQWLEPLRETTAYRAEVWADDPVVPGDPDDR